MKFSELELLMSSQGINTLAEIARTLDTTPQAVSNWKSRDQVPNYIALKINNNQNQNSQQVSTLINNNFDSNETEVGITDILLTLASQLKLIVLITFLFVFATFTYVQFLEKPTYVSSAKLLLSQNSSLSGSLGNVAGLASKFGLNLNESSQVDLSSPSLLPDLVKSRTFAERMLEKSFYIKEYDKKIKLLEILTGDSKQQFSKDTLIQNATVKFHNMVTFSNEGTFSILNVETDDPHFSRDLNIEVLSELLKLNSFYKNQQVNETIRFIENRIGSVESDLFVSEKSLKLFSETNRQITSPSLQLEEGRLKRDVEIQEGVFLTLKQQLELSKIELVQKSSIIQILDEPKVPINGQRSSRLLSIIVSAFVGFSISFVLAFVRSSLNNADMQERKKIRQIKNFVLKKSKDLILDYRVSGVLGAVLLLALPLYLGYESQNPVFFGRYSYKLMIIITFYSITLFLLIVSFLRAIIKRKK